MANTPIKPAAPAEGAAPRGLIKIDVRPPRKRRYSRGLEDMQRMQRGWTKAAARAAEAVTAGLTSFRDRSEESALSKRDGAVRDGLKNWARAMRKSMKKASRVPEDLVKPMNTRLGRRVLRSLLRLFSLPLLRR